MITQTFSADLMKRKIIAAQKVLLASGVIALDGSGSPAVESLLYAFAKLAQGEASIQS